MVTNSVKTLLKKILHRLFTPDNRYIRIPILQIRTQAQRLSHMPCNTQVRSSKTWAVWPQGPHS